MKTRRLCEDWSGRDFSCGPRSHGRYSWNEFQVDFMYERTMVRHNASEGQIPRDKGSTASAVKVSVSRDPHGVSST